MGKELLKSLAQKILKSQSFSFSTFAEAKKALYLKCSSEKIKYVYDRLSLCVYRHNLSGKDFSILSSALSTGFHERDSEQQKRRLEYGTLFHYYQFHKEFKNAEIAMNLHPDFVLTINNRNIGIEITELTTPKDKVLARIATENFGKGLRAQVIHKNATAKHGIKANYYEYMQVGDTVAVGIGSFDVNRKKELFAEQIFGKYKKYAEVSKQYDDFIILCNAQHGICITSRYDAEDVFNQVAESGARGCQVVILADNESGNPFCYERRF